MTEGDSSIPSTPPSGGRGSSTSSDPKEDDDHPADEEKADEDRFMNSLENIETTIDEKGRKTFKDKDGIWHTLPTMGGVKQARDNEWLVWSGGKPKFDWTGL